MMRHIQSFLVISWVVACPGFMASGRLAWGQDAPEPPPPEQAQPAESEPAESEPAESDPVVLAIQQSNPSEPAPLVRAIRNLLDLDRPQLAQNYLKQLLESKPDAAELVRLHQTYGTGLFLRLSQDERIQPQGGELAQAVLDAAGRWARAPKRIAGLVQQLVSDPAPARRRAAYLQLRNTPTAAVVPLIRALRREGAPAEQSARAHGALVALGDLVVEPLIGLLDAPDGPTQTAAIRILGQAKATRAIPYLLRPYLSDRAEPSQRAAAGRALQSIVGSLPSDAEGQTLLVRRIESFLAGERFPGEPSYDGIITLWRWDAEQQTVVAVRYRADDAAVQVASDLAGDLYHLWPDRPEYQRLYLLASLEAVKRTVGFDRPLPRGSGTAYGLAVAAGSDMVEAVLRQASETGHDGAAMGAAEVLGEVGNAMRLSDPQGRPRPLVRALRHPNHRVRMAAARSIMAIRPQYPYPGAGALRQLLRYAVATGGTRRVLIGTPNRRDADSIAGFVRQLGFESDYASTGRELNRLAARNPDYQFLVISESIDHPRASELLQHLRQHPYTARLPVALVATGTRYPYAEQLAQGDGLTIALPRPGDLESVTSMAERLLRQDMRNHIQPDERLRDGNEALAWLAQLAGDRKSFSLYDLILVEPALEAALATPGLAMEAINALAAFGTPNAQTALLNLVHVQTRPIAVRRAAIEGLARAIDRNRVQLTAGQIQLQQRRYRDSAHRDDTTRELLGSVLKMIGAGAEVD